VRLVLDHPDGAVLVHGDARRRDDVRLAGDQFDDEAVISGSGRGGKGGTGEGKEQGGGEQAGGKGRHDGVLGQDAVGKRLRFE
jgi:hypothetical protein